jgi:hypothetical protein
MTDKATRKQAIAEYKQQKRRAGVYAVRCTSTGRSWVGATPTLDAAKNKTWFLLRTGSSRDTDLLAAWQAHGEDAFTFEVLEELDEDVAPMLKADELRTKLREWAQRENAGTLLR